MAPVTKSNYVRHYMPSHPRANTQGYIYEHVFVVEQALGHCLPDGAEVHHVNERRRDNRNRNLVVCQDHAYHAFLHQRSRAYRACGNVDWRPCVFCKEHAAVADMDVRRRTTKVSVSYHHKSCLSDYRREHKLVALRKAA